MSLAKAPLERFPVGPVPLASWRVASNWSLSTSEPNSERIPSRPAAGSRSSLAALISSLPSTTWGSLEQWGLHHPSDPSTSKHSLDRLPAFSETQAIWSSGAGALRGLWGCPPCWPEKPPTPSCPCPSGEAEYIFGERRQVIRAVVMVEVSSSWFPLLLFQATPIPWKAGDQDCGAAPAVCLPLAC